jgi:hypothetical protein
VRIPVRHGGTAPAKPPKLAFGAFFKLSVIAVTVHFLSDKNIGKPVREHITDHAVHTAAGVNVAVWEYRQMRNPAVAAVVNHLVVQAFGDGKKSFFVT